MPSLSTRIGSRLPFPQAMRSLAPRAARSVRASAPAAAAAQGGGKGRPQKPVLFIQKMEDEYPSIPVGRQANFRRTNIFPVFQYPVFPGPTPPSEVKGLSIISAGSAVGGQPCGEPRGGSSLLSGPRPAAAAVLQRGDAGKDTNE